MSFLPQEFCDHLTKVRELDLDASNRRDNVEKLKERLATEFIPKGRPVTSGDAGTARKHLTPAERTALTVEIASEYDRIVQLNVEKVRIVAGLGDLMEKYNRCV